MGLEYGSWASERVDMVNRELRPLSLAQPQIRFQLLAPDELSPADPKDLDPADLLNNGPGIPGWNGWWHAAGIDLRRGILENSRAILEGLDPLFFSEKNVMSRAAEADAEAWAAFQTFQKQHAAE